MTFLAIIGSYKIQDTRYKVPRSKVPRSQFWVAEKTAAADFGIHEILLAGDSTTCGARSVSSDDLKIDCHEIGVYCEC